MGRPLNQKVGLIAGVTPASWEQRPIAVIVPANQFSSVIVGVTYIDAFFDNHPTTISYGSRSKNNVTSRPRGSIASSVFTTSSEISQSAS